MAIPAGWSTRKIHELLFLTDRYGALVFYISGTVILLSAGPVFHAPAIPVGVRAAASAHLRAVLWCSPFYADCGESCPR